MKKCQKFLELSGNFDDFRMNVWKYTQGEREVGGRDKSRSVCKEFGQGFQKNSKRILLL